MATLDYDKETSTLTIQVSDQKIVDSESIDNLIIDFDSNRNIVSIEVLNFNPDSLN